MTYMAPLARGETPCDDCDWYDGWPHCTMNCSDTGKTLRIPNEPGYIQPKCINTLRDADHAHRISLAFDRELTVEELSALHEHIRKFHYRQPWSKQDD